MALDYPDNLQYVDSHEYIRLEDEVATIGITAFAVDQLGDIVFVELPEEGVTLEKGDTLGSVESVKAVEDLYAPIGGKVVAVNAPLVDSPESLTDDPYGEAWLFKMEVANSDELADLMSADEYRSLVEA